VKATGSAGPAAAVHSAPPSALQNAPSTPAAASSAAPSSQGAPPAEMPRASLPPLPSSSPSAAPQRILAGTDASRSRTGTPPLQVIGARSAFYEDLYHFLLTRTWPQFFGLVGLSFFAVNALFAVVFWIMPGSIANARPGSFEDSFYFSVQTLATIGYGGMTPATRYAHIAVVFEALVGMLMVALVTGVTFAKFARPTARVIFSNKIVIARRDGVPHLMFRLANFRHNAIVEAQLRVIVLVEEKTAEGHSMRRSIDVPLVRERSSVFFMTWTAMHLIDEKSPFFGSDALERLRARKAEIFLTVIGIDATSSQTVHARMGYRLEDIVVNAHFADVLEIREDGLRVINYTRFHDVVPIEGAPGSGAGSP
jgi:inward rectifier potassium channel